MTFQDVSAFAQTWGLIFLIVMFVIAVGYALWPRNKAKFQRAANLPLLDDEETPFETGEIRARKSNSSEDHRG